MRISDWSSDVCSSDLSRESLRESSLYASNGLWKMSWRISRLNRDHSLLVSRNRSMLGREACSMTWMHNAGEQRSEERRVGTEGVGTSRSGWSRYDYKKNNRKRNTRNTIHTREN